MDQKSQNTGFLRRIFSFETFLFCVGLGLIAYGLIDGTRIMPVFFGLCIVVGRALLRLVRKRDWDAHWAAQEMVRQAHEARVAEDRDGES